MTLKNAFGDLNLETTQQEVKTAIEGLLTDDQLRASPVEVGANLKVSNSDVGPSNPVPITGNVAVSGAELQIEKAIEATNFSLQASAFNQTTVIGGDYKLNRVELKFSTSEPRDITITSTVSGAVLYQRTSNTNLIIELYGEGEGFNSGDQIQLQVSQTTNPCLMTATVFIERGALPLTGDPSIGGFTPTYFSATATATGVLIGPVELGSKGFISLHVRYAFGTFDGAFVVEGTNDPSAAANWTTLRVESISGLSTSTIKNSGIFFIPTVTRWTRVRCSAFNSGTADLNLLVSPQARPSFGRYIQDRDGISAWGMTPFGNGRVAQSLWQAGSSFDGTALNKQEWESIVTNGGSYVLGGGEVRLRTNAVNATSAMESRKAVEFLGDTENECIFALRLGDTGVANNAKRWGVFDELDGFFIEQYHDGSTGKLRAVTRKGGVDTIDTLFPLGVVAPTNTSTYQFWRFVYTPSFILVYQGSNLVHLFISGTTNPLSPLFGRFMLPARFEIINSGGSSVDSSIYCQYAAVSRVGQEDSRKVIKSAILATETPLDANGVWESEWEDCQQFPHLAVRLKGEPGTARGVLRVYFTEDPTFADPLTSLMFNIDDLNLNLPFPFVNYGPFVKLRYENSTTIQTQFRLHLLQYRHDPGLLTRFQTQVIGPNEPLKVMRTLVEPSFIGERGLLGADREVFGAAIVGSRISRLSLNPTQSLASSDVTLTQTNGTVTQEASHAEFRLQSASATATVRMQSNIAVRYRPARELYVMVPARFTTGIANVSQRVGHFTDNNGFFFGYEGTQFGFTVRRAGVDTFTPLTSANGDPLDGTSRSRFARGTLLEAIDPTKKNVWRTRVGLLGSSIQFFDVQSPDGLWMRVQTNQFANSLETASILEWDLPFRAEIIKTGAATTNIVIGIGSVDSGYVGDPYGLEPSGVNSRSNVTISLLGETTSGIKYTVPTGRRLIIKSFSVAASNSSTTTTARIRFRDGATGTLLSVITVDEASGGVSAAATYGNSLPEGVRAMTNVYMEIVTGTVDVDATIVGYLEPV